MSTQTTQLRLTGFPRIVAHRGIPAVCPENTLVSFGAAVAAGADEIEFDVCSSADGELVVSHDPSVERISDGHGLISELSWDEIRTFDVGGRKDPKWRGVGYCLFEDVLSLFAGRTVMNIHVKPEPDGNEELLFRRVDKIIRLLKQYGCDDKAYIAGHEPVMEAALRIDSSLGRCCLDRTHDYTLVENAIRYRCGRLQFFKPFFNPQMVERAHAAGIRCNVFYSDDPEETLQYLEMGIDAILSNNILLTAPVVRAFASEK